MKRALVALAAVAALAGCGGQDASESIPENGVDGNIYVFEKDTPRGTFQCIAWDGNSYAGGMDCERIK